ncbi:MAG TPA: tetraacyldisaccharide 4'-kinase [Gemmatimonadaceae bacterium]|jgi:tetraacyldisaccharide 4'-kinase|nr:tetraacyldisaccharide 4'-kinase [Gemmatimonadaceae bacterium]
MSKARRFVEGVWTGRDRRSVIARALLSPAEWLYGTAVAARGKLYDWNVLRVAEFSAPVLSVGNLSVGGTGKTPISAWFARQLGERGVAAAIVLRGYGGDEIVVHERLNPEIPVIASPDRVRGIREAIAQGASVVILDDAFQHRRASRDADVLLVNADAWTGRPRLLPAGPWRESLRAARRATLVIVTRKTAGAAAVADVTRALANAAPRVPFATVHLAPGELKSTSTGQTLPLHAIDGADLTAIAAIAQPDSFFRQLTELGAVVRPQSFPDHYAFTRADARRIAAEASSSDFVVCTLKDAVKLERIWPAEAGSLWYVSQRLRFEDGQQHIDRLLDDLSSPRT